MEGHRSVDDSTPQRDSRPCAPEPTQEIEVEEPVLDPKLDKELQKEAVTLAARCATAGLVVGLPLAAIGALLPRD